MSTHVSTQWPIEVLLWRITAFAVTWWVVAEGDLRGWGYGVAAVLVATVVSLVMAPMRRRVRPRLRGVLRLAGYTLVQLVVGGIDVARRAVDPRLPIDPGMVEVELAHRDGAVRALVVVITSMLPGTVCATVGEHSVMIHALDVNQDVAVRVRHTERLVVAAIGVAE